MNLPSASCTVTFTLEDGDFEVLRARVANMLSPAPTSTDVAVHRLMMGTVQDAVRAHREEVERVYLRNQHERDQQLGAVAGLRWVEALLARLVGDAQKEDAR